MNSVAACKPKSANPTRSETCIPVQPKTAELPVPPSAPLPQLASQVVPSSKTTKTTVPNGPKPKRKRIRLKTPRRREQCRTNQARYRKKQTEYAKTLEVTVGQLRLEIPKLEMQHRQLISNAKASLWNVVVEYFHLFRNGSRSMGPRSSGPKAWLQTSEAEQQLLFLRSAMAEDVLIGEQRGVEAMVELWKRCTYYFDDLHFRLKHMTKVSENFIAATASLTVTVSEATLQLCLPSNEEFRRNTAQEAKMATVRSKLLGQRLVFPCRLSFEYNEATKRIVRLENSVDLLSSLIQVLGSIEDAAFVLERALLTSS
ncbi:Bzip transcription factor [Phytophthora megakarya]|uniref:Bzip transcription factor n=1 Tax=Phytophthora megakarya TaxID=4795 RepID=A0A225WV09_9STRA|nr:Bzip transcription factor [Phytophthora megakarya]